MEFPSRNSSLGVEGILVEPSKSHTNALIRQDEQWTPSSRNHWLFIHQNFTRWTNFLGGCSNNYVTRTMRLCEWMAWMWSVHNHTPFIHSTSVTWHEASGERVPSLNAGINDPSALGPSNGLIPPWQCYAFVFGLPGLHNRFHFISSAEKVGEHEKRTELTATPHSIKWLPEEWSCTSHKSPAAAPQEEGAYLYFVVGIPLFF